jgi:uncharacterized protein YcfJ
MDPRSALLSVCVGLALLTTSCVTPDTEPTYTSSTDYEFRRRPNERLYEAPVTDVRAIVGPTERRCWVERERVSATGPTVGGAIAGAVVGGILGHQIGSGRGNDAATAGGAIAGGAIGATAGRRAAYRDVERCEVAASTSVEYWDVTYEWRGIEHHVQMTSPPGRAVTVNSEGEPRES